MSEPRDILATCEVCEKSFESEWTEENEQNQKLAESIPDMAYVFVCPDCYDLYLQMISEQNMEKQPHEHH